MALPVDEDGDEDDENDGDDGHSYRQDQQQGPTLIRLCKKKRKIKCKSCRLGLDGATFAAFNIGGFNSYNGHLRLAGAAVPHARARCAAIVFRLM